MKWNLLLVLSLWAMPARAAVVVYGFAGQLDAPFGTLAAGTPFSGEFSYEQTQTAIVEPPLPGGRYVSLNLSLMIGGSPPFSTGSGTIYVLDNAPFDLLRVLSTTFTGSVGGLPLWSAGGVELLLPKMDGSLWSGFALPGPGLTLADFDSSVRLALTTQGSGPVIGTLTSLAAVPEPSGAMLSAAGLMFLLRWRRMGRD